MNLDQFTLAIYPAGGKVFYGLQQRRIPARSLVHCFKDLETTVGATTKKNTHAFFQAGKKMPRGKDGAKKVEKEHTVVL